MTMNQINQTKTRSEQLATKRQLEDELARLATMTCQLCGQEVTGYEAAIEHDQAEHPETV